MSDTNARVTSWLSGSKEDSVPAKALPTFKPRAEVIDLTSDTASSPASSTGSFHSAGPRPPPPPFEKLAPIFQQQPQGEYPRPAVLSHSTNNKPSGSGLPFRPLDNQDPAAPLLSAKAKATEAMRAEQASLNLPKAAGVPIAVPKPFAAYPTPEAPVDDEEVLKAMEGLNIKDNLSSADQESALKALFDNAVDLADVDTTADAPEELTTQLFPHQRLGLHWLVDREAGKKSGGILGDDMGLGKTVQMIALILANKPESKPKTTLIVCPVGLMDQWKNEIEKHTDGSLRVGVHHGAKRETEARRLRKFDVLITSYQTAASEWVDPKPKKKKGGKGKADDDISGNEGEAKECGALFDENTDVFHRIILDEAHQIKGRSTRMHKACCDLRAKFRWCLTGTPVQNDVMDLFSLFEFLGPVVKPLNELATFKSRISEPLKAKRAKIAMARLQVVLAAIMLRRTKTMLIDGKPLLQLPAREIINAPCEFLYEDERLFYEAVEQKMQLQMNSFITAGTMMSNYTSVLILLLRMRQACSHPALVTGSSIYLDDDALEPEPQRQKPASADETVDDIVGGLDKLAVNAAEVSCLLCDTPADEGAAYCGIHTSEGAKYPKLKFSTKIRKMISTLEEIRAESSTRKTIVFSQFTSMFDLIEPFLKEGKFKFVRFDGSMDTKKKAGAIDKITNDPRTTVILISIKAGSVGLNLTCCSRVILMDLWWNPAIESQAFDRAHRMGQKEDVKIYKITVKNTIEDRILTLQGQKADLANACLDGGTLKAGKLSMADMLFLFRGDA